MGTCVVKNEIEAWDLLAQCLATPADFENERVIFDGWPTISVVIDPGDGKGSDEITTASRQLQLAAYRAYSLVVNRHAILTP